MGIARADCTAPGVWRCLLGAVHQVELLLLGCSLQQWLVLLISIQFSHSCHAVCPPLPHWFWQQLKRAHSLVAADTAES